MNYCEKVVTGADTDTFSGCGKDGIKKTAFYPPSMDKWGGCPMVDKKSR